MKTELELFPGFNEIARPVFANWQEYDEFRSDFYEKVKPQLDEYARKRALSELESRSRYVR